MPTAAQRAAAVSKREVPSSVKKTEVRSPATATVLSGISRAPSSETVSSRLFTPTVASKNAFQAKREVSPAEPGIARSSTMGIMGRTEGPSVSADTKPRSSTLRESSSGLGGAPTAASINARQAKKEGVSSGSPAVAGKSAFGVSRGLPQRASFTPSPHSRPPVSSSGKDSSREKPNAVPKTIFGRAPSRDSASSIAEGISPQTDAEETLGDSLKQQDTLSRPRSDSFEKIVVLTKFTALHLDNVLMHLQVINTALKLAAKQLNALVVARNTKDFSFQWLEFQKAFYINLHIEEKRIFPLLDRFANSAISNAKLRETNANEMIAVEAITSELTKTNSIAKSTFDQWKLLFIANIDKKEPIITKAEKSLGKTFDERAMVVFKEIMCPEFISSKSELAWTIGWCAMILSDHVEVVDLGYFLKALQSISSPEQYALFQEKVKSNIAAKQWAKLVMEYGVDAPGKQTIEPPSLLPPAKGDSRFGNYFKMLKIGLPIDAAAIKMTNDRMVASYDEAMEILSLNPDEPLPDKFRSRPVVQKIEPPKPVVAATVDHPPVPCLLFIQFMREGLRLVVDLLASYLVEGNSKDFLFLWEEYLKAFVIYSDLNSRYFFPAIVMLSGIAFTSLDMAKERDRQNVLTNEIKADIKKGAKANTIIFDNWKKVTIELLDAEAKVFDSAEKDFGDSSDEKARLVSEEMLSPAFGGSKNDFTWCLGWCAMIFGQFGGNSTNLVEKLGHLLLCLQSVSSPNQYAFLRDRIHKGVDSQLWAKISKAYGADGTGRQPEPEYQKPVLRDDPRFQKFFKMMKVGLSTDAAANQMVQERRAPDFSTAMKLLALEPDSPLPDDMEKFF